MSDLKKVKDSIKILSDTYSKPKQLRGWQETLTALQTVSAWPTPLEMENTLLTVVRHRGQLNLAADDWSLPPDMTAEELLQMQAAQALVRWTGKKHMEEIQKLGGEAKSDNLRNACADLVKQFYPAGK